MTGLFVPIRSTAVLRWDLTKEVSCKIFRQRIALNRTSFTSHVEAIVWCFSLFPKVLIEDRFHVRLVRHGVCLDLEPGGQRAY